MTKLWSISQDKNDDYDTYDQAVVAADTAGAAKLIHPNGHESWDGRKWHSKGRLWVDGTWAPPDDVTAIEIGEAGPDIQPGHVVCSSFNAG